MRTCQSAGAVRSPHAGGAVAGAKGDDADGACAGVVDCAVTAPTGWRPSKGKEEKAQE